MSEQRVTDLRVGDMVLHPAGGRPRGLAVVGVGLLANAAVVLWVWVLGSTWFAFGLPGPRGHGVFVTGLWVATILACSIGACASTGTVLVISAYGSDPKDEGGW